MIRYIFAQRNNVWAALFTTYFEIDNHLEINAYNYTFNIVLNGFCKVYEPNHRELFFADLPNACTHIGVFVNKQNSVLTWEFDVSFENTCL